VVASETGISGTESARDYLVNELGLHPEVDEVLEPRRLVFAYRRAVAANGTAGSAATNPRDDPHVLEVSSKVFRTHNGNPGFNQ